jgi:hypothetical protein
MVAADEEEDGLLPRCISLLYAGIRQRSARADMSVSASCMELYNESVCDLLGTDKAKQLQVILSSPSMLGQLLLLMHVYVQCC